MNSCANRDLLETISPPSSKRSNVDYSAHPLRAYFQQLRAANNDFCCTGLLRNTHQQCPVQERNFGGGAFCFPGLQHQDLNSWRLYPIRPTEGRPTGEVRRPYALRRSNGRFNYFSPGIACPSDWTTAGVATKDSAGSLTSSGIFTPLVPFFAPDLYPPNVFIEAMAPDQTAVLCCPSGWKGDGYRCSSALSSFREFSTGCNFAIPPEDVTFYYTTYTEPGSTTGAIGDIYTMTHTAPASETIVTTFESWEIADWAPVTALPILALLHRASDLSDTATTTSTSGTSARPGFSFLLAAGMGLLGSVAAVSGGLPF